MTLNELRKIAATKGATIRTQRDIYGWSYWLLDSDGKDLFDDDNFHTSKDSVLEALNRLLDTPEYFVKKCLKLGFDEKDFNIELDGTSANTENSPHQFHWRTDCRIEWAAQK